MGFSNFLTPIVDSATRVTPDSQQPEPLLALITSHHPLLSTAINGSISAYTSSKSYSARFKSGAEFVERLGSPVVNTMGTAGRLSGVESGVRWMLRKRESSEQSQSNKRRRVGLKDSPEVDIESGLSQPSAQHHVRHQFSEMSIAEPLPPYDGQRSPDYEAKNHTVQPGHESQTPQNQHWGTKFMMTTSALTAALNEESLRSLKYCLSWLLWANNHLGQNVVALKSVIEEWDRSRQDPVHTGSHVEGQDDNSSGNTEERPAARSQATISKHIQTLKDDVLQTLKKVGNIVSTYAGGALPNNARELVRLHLKSLPQRFHLATAETKRCVGGSNGETQGAPPDTMSSAHRVLLLATAGLDMTKQVSEILNSTIVSAEDWCNTFGKKKSEKEEKKNEAPEAWRVAHIKREGHATYPVVYKPHEEHYMGDTQMRNEKPRALNLANANTVTSEDTKQQLADKGD